MAEEKEAQPPDRGLGDTIKRATTAIGIRPCGGCRRRAEMLNRLVPYRHPDRAKSPAESNPAAESPKP